MKNIITTLLLIMCLSMSAQKVAKQLDTELLKTYTNYFTIENTKLSGEGAEVLKDIIRTSQFVVYGEIHGSRQTSIINEALMPLLADSGFKYFAIEVGPHSAEKLTVLSTPANKTTAQLKAFNSAYTVSQGGDTAVPIPFFDNVSDAKFLQAARSNGMHLWGLDQEFYFSTFYLMDELTKTAKNNANYQDIVQLQNKAKAIMFKHFIGEFKKENEGAYSLIIKEPAVTNYFNAFDTSNKKAQAIIKDLKISWDIYIHWRNDSHADRISYMRDNFMKNYKKALKTEEQPKVYTKIGSLHARKILSNGAYDIGELVEYLANENGTKATTIGSWIPYEVSEDGSIINYFEKYKRSYKRYKLFMPLAKQDQWTIINLKAIRAAIENKAIALPKDGSYHKLRQLIYAYDYQLIIPADLPTIPNRS
ncbi:hypothetical protein [uncultured Winogradskyella sp.]|uniref:hypothetical protein n=1 Tax=uncultured Winogradskyella sp. TaxID=395353 RepID=UPI00262C230B|nr:hypothetical protein [uncultured Winogradskyella sp.]